MSALAIVTNNPAGAAQAYAQAASRALDGAVSDGVEIGAAPGGPSFGSMVQDMLGNAAESARTAEKVSINAVTGKTDVVDLVTAINNAEMTLQTVVAVRDKVVQAYQEVVRMSI